MSLKISKLKKKYKSQTRLIIKRTLLLFSFLIISYYAAKWIFKPNISQYPNLTSCFNTSIFKINLCPSNPNYSSIKNISKYFIHSVLISEDDSFYIHQGIDWNEFKKSFIQNLKLKRFARGGSTITQQLVKNVYLSKNKSILRKFKEILLAQQVEDNYSKSVILEKYLNVIELGNNIYGIKQASRVYFEKAPSQLNLLESIYLTTLLPNPKLYSQSFYQKKLPEWQRERIATLLQRLLRRKRISYELYASAKSKINLFPWKNIDLFETQKPEDDNLDFLNNINGNFSNQIKYEPKSYDGTDPTEEPTDTELKNEYFDADSNYEINEDLSEENQTINSDEPLNTEKEDSKDSY
jgi:monofunctional glycosyltransferase